MHVSWECSSAARLSWKDVNVCVEILQVFVCVNVFEGQIQKEHLKGRCDRKKRGKSRRKGERWRKKCWWRVEKESDCTAVCPRQMVRRWGMKEKEAVGNDVFLSSFQAESNYQNSISSSEESNCCPVYSLINTAVLWSCTIKPCFHYLHCSYYDHWKRVTVRPGCCEDSGTLIFCFGSLSLSFSECNVLWRRMSCSLLCTSMPLSIQITPPPHQSVLETHKEHVCRSDSVCGLSVCVGSKGRESWVSASEERETVWDISKEVNRSKWAEWELKHPTKY